MLSTEHLRYRKKGSSIFPIWVQESTTWKNHAAKVLSTFRNSVGMTLDQAQESWAELEASFGRSQKVIRGMRFLLEKKVKFEEMDPQKQISFRQDKLKQQVLDLRNSQQCPPFPRQQQPDLYKDLPSRRMIIGTPDYSPLELIRRYNLALAQGLCLHANEIQITTQAMSAQEARYLMRYLKFFGLLVSVRQKKEDILVMTIEGPLTDFGGGKRYRSRMAAVCGAFPFIDYWRLDAIVELERRSFTLSIDHENGLRSHYQSFMEYTPVEWSDFSEKLLKKLGSSWQTQPCQWPPRSVEQWICPDWIFKHTSGVSFQLFIYQVNQSRQLMHDRWHLKPPQNGTIVCFDKRILKKISFENNGNMTTFNAFPNITSILKIIRSWPEPFPK